MTTEEIWERAARVWSVESRAIDGLARTVDRAAFTRCVQVLAECTGRVVTMGCGTSAAAARKIAHTLSCVERPAFFLSPSDAPHGALGAVQRGDVTVLVSKGGATAELVSLLPSIKARGALVIGVTEREDSILARSSDLSLRIRVEEEADDFNLLATASTMAVVAVFDAVAVTLVRLTGYTREKFAVIHPGGAVGDRLRGQGD